MSIGPVPLLTPTSSKRATAAGSASGDGDAFARLVARETDRLDARRDGVADRSRAEGRSEVARRRDTDDHTSRAGDSARPGAVRDRARVEGSRDTGTAASDTRVTDGGADGAAVSAAGAGAPAAVDRMATDVAAKPGGQGAVAPEGADGSGTDGPTVAQDGSDVLPAGTSGSVAAGATGAAGRAGSTGLVDAGDGGSTHLGHTAGGAVHAGADTSGTSGTAGSAPVGSVLADGQALDDTVTTSSEHVDGAVPGVAGDGATAVANGGATGGANAGAGVADVVGGAAQGSTATGGVGTGDAAQAPTPARATTASLVEQVGPTLTRLVSRGNGEHKMTLTIHPADLGEVQLTVVVRGDRVDVDIAASAEARELLRDGLGSLRSLLDPTGRGGGQLVFRDLPGAAGSAGQSSSQAAGQQGGTAADASADDGNGRGQSRPDGAGAESGTGSGGGSRGDAGADGTPGRGSETTGSADRHRSDGRSGDRGMPGAASTTADTGSAKTDRARPGASAFDVTV